MADGDRADTTVAVVDRTARPSESSPIVITAIDSTLVKTGWLPIERVSRYVISSKPAGAADGTFRTVAAMPGDKNEATIDNLPPGVDITVRVVAEVEIGVVTVRGFASIDRVNVTDVTDATATLEWTPARGATFYRVDYRVDTTATFDDDATIPFHFMSDTTAPKCSLKGLEAGRLYLFRVRAGSGTLLHEDGPSATVSAAECVRDLTVTSLTATTATIAWRAGAGGQRFKVDKRMVGAQQADVVATGITDTTLTVTGLKTGFEHNLTVYTAGNGDMYHRNGESVKVRPLASPKTVSFGKVTHDSVELRWDVDGPGADSFLIVSRPKSYNAPETRALASGQRETVIGGLEPGTETEFQIFSGCGGQFETEGSTVLSVTTLKAPSDLTVDEMTATSVSLEWSGVPTATRYRVQYTLLAERGTLRQNIRPRLVTDECEQPMALITNLLSLATYRFEVFSGTSTNFESEGTSVEVTTYESPKNLTVTALTESSVALAWEYPYQIPKLTFAVVCKRLEGDQDPFTQLVSQPNCVIENITAGLIYEIKVYAGDGKFFERSGSNAVTVQPLENIRVVTLLGVTSSTATVCWDPVPFAESYLIRFGSTDRDRSRTIEVSSCNAEIGPLQPGIETQAMIHARSSSGLETVGCRFALMTLSSVRDLSITSISGSTVDFNWKPSIGADRYFIDYRTTFSKDEPFRSNGEPVTACSGKISKLIPGEEIEIRVRAGGGPFVEASGTSIVVTPISPMSGLSDDDISRMSLGQLRDALRQLGMFSEADILAMTEEELRAALRKFGKGIHVLELTAKSAKLRWNPSTGASRYKIECSSEHSRPWVYSDQIRSIESVVEPLETGVDNCIRIFAGTDKHGFGGESVAITLRPLPPPSRIIAKSILESSVILEWTSVQGATRYFLDYFPTGAEQRRQFLEVQGSTQAQISSLQTGIEYSIRVFAGHRDYLETRGSPPLAVVPLAPPTRLRFSKILESQIGLVWNQPHPACNRYRIEYSMKGLQGQNDRRFVVSESHPTTSIDMDGLKPNLEYSFFVFAGSEGGFESSGATISGVPLQPVTKLTVTRNAADSTEVSWENHPCATVFRVAVFNADATIDDQPLLEELVRKPQFVTSALRIGTRYRFLVYSGIADLSIFETVGRSVVATPLEAVSDFRALFVTPSGIQLVWSPVKFASRYRLECQNKTGDFVTVSENVIECSADLNGLKAGREFVFRIFAGCETGFETVGALTKATPLDVIQSIQLDEISEDRFACSWPPVLGATHYQVDLFSDPKWRTVAMVTEPSFQAQGLVVGRIHMFRLRAGRDGIFQNDGTPFEVKPMPSAKPELLGIDATSVAIAWPPIDGAVKYLVEWRIVDPRSNRRIEDSSCGSKSLSATEVTVGGLTSGREYEFTVKVGSEHGFENKGGSVRAVPLQPPTNLQTEYMDGVLLKWTPPPGATCFKVDMKLVMADKIDVPWQSMASDYPSSQLHLKDLLPFVKYCFRVFAGTQYAYESRGIQETMEVILEPKNPAEMERAVDRLLLHLLRALEKEIPGLSLITKKVGPNMYRFGDKVLNLTILKGMIMCRVGGGYMDLALWIITHKDMLLRYIDRNAGEIWGAIDTVAKVKTESQGNGSGGGMFGFATGEDSGVLYEVGQSSLQSPEMKLAMMRSSSNVLEGSRVRDSSSRLSDPMRVTSRSFSMGTNTDSWDGRASRGAVPMILKPGR